MLGSSDLGKRYRLGTRRFGLFGSNHLELFHPAEDLISLGQGRAAVAQRRKAVRASDQPGKDGCLGERELVSRLAKAGAGGRFHSIEPEAVVDPVCVGLQDFFLAQILLDPESEQGLDKLLPPAVVAEIECISGELLCNRTGSFLDIAGVDVAHGRASDASEVHTAMLVESRVLPCQERIDEIRRDLRERHNVTHLTFELAVAHARVIEDLRYGRNVVQLRQVETVRHPLVFAVFWIDEQKCRDHQPDAGER